MENAESSEDVNEFLGTAVGAVAGTTAAVSEIVGKISEVKEKVETDSDIVVDFSEMMAASKTLVEKPGEVALALAKNAGDANLAQKILAEAAGALLPQKEELDEVLQDDTLTNEFSLRRKICLRW